MNNFQRVGAVFGLAASLFFVANVGIQWFWVQGLAEVTPAAIVQWANDHQLLLFLYPILIIAMIFYGILLQAIEDRLKTKLPNLAMLSGRLAWITITIMIFMLLAQWFHLFLNSVVWSLEIAHQFSRLTFNMITFLQIASYPFLAGWMIVFGLGGIRSRLFSKSISWVALILGLAITLDFFAELWQPFLEIPLIEYWRYLPPFTIVFLIWISFELFFSAE